MCEEDKIKNIKHLIIAISAPNVLYLDSTFNPLITRERLFPFKNSKKTLEDFFKRILIASLDSQGAILTKAIVIVCKCVKV